MSWEIQWKKKYKKKVANILGLKWNRIWSLMLGIGFLHPKKHHVHSYVEYNFVLWLVDEMTSHQAPLYFFPFKKAPLPRKNKIKTTYDKPPNSHPIPFRYRNISALPFETERERERGFALKYALDSIYIGFEFWPDNRRLI